MSVEAGYQIGRDEHGLTEREREVLGCLMEGKSPAEAAKMLGLSRQRAHQLTVALMEKGVVAKEGRKYVPVK